jgi:hypothetical protein
VGVKKKQKHLILVRVYCNEENTEKIIGQTLQHYGQEAVSSPPPEALEEKIKRDRTKSKQPEKN